MTKHFSIHKIKNERGLASIMVTTVLIMVIGLIIVGFSQTTRRNQRETLDRQLSTQAFYAAETGVNAAAAIAAERFATNGNVPRKDSCNDTVGGIYPALELDAALGIEVTCMLVDTGLPSMYYSNVDEDDGIVAAVISADGTPINRITMVWRPTTIPAGPASSGCSAPINQTIFTPKNIRTCAFGVLRTDIAPRSTGSDSRTAMSFFANPVLPFGGGSITYDSAGGGGGLVTGSCSLTGNDPRCQITINGLNAPDYYLRVRSLYKDSTLTITARAADSSVINLDGQALIDVTGKAQDVLRRIQVRVPLMGDAGDVPNFAVESTDSICKRFTIAPGNPAHYDPTDATLCPLP